MKEKITLFLGIIIVLFLLTTRVFASISQDLFRAIEKGSIEEVKSTIGKGVNVNDRDPLVGDTPLARAIRKGNLGIVKCLVEHGSSVNEVDAWNNTPLHKAVNHQNLDIVKFLVENGANIDAREDANGETPLMVAVFWNNFDIVDYLLNKGAEVNKKDNRGRTALEAAKQSGAQAIVSRLEGRPSEAKLIATNRLVIAVKKGDLDGVKSALSQGADINEKMFRGRPLFVDAVTWKKSGVDKSKLDIAKYLIESGADVNLKDDDGVPPLVHIVKWGYFDLVKILVEKKAKIVDTALMFADDFDIFSYLIANGARIDVKGKDGTTLLMFAVMGVQVAPETTHSVLRIIEYLIKNGVDINEKNADGFTALMYAAVEGQIDIVKYLIERGARINEKDNKGRTPLITAVRYQHFNIIEYLVKEGADLNIKDGEGKTALDIAQEISKSAKERAKFGLAYRMEGFMAYKIENYLKSKKTVK